VVPTGVIGTNEDGDEDRVRNVVPTGVIGTNEDGDEDRVRNVVPTGVIGTNEDERENKKASESTSDRARFLVSRTGLKTVAYFEGSTPARREAIVAEAKCTKQSIAR
jgi:hypothetical protein